MHLDIRVKYNLDDDEILYQSFEEIPNYNSVVYIKYWGNQDLHILPELPLILVYLDCQTNPIDVLPKLPETLTTLICRDNELTILPPKLSPNLIHLDCGRNRLTSLPELPNNLKKLLCGDNLLISLPTLPNRIRSFMLR